SASAPHVAGVVALILDKNSNLSPAQVANILGDTATDLGQTGFDDIFGFGRVDAFEGVQSVTQGNNSGNQGGDNGKSGCSLASTSFNSSAAAISNSLMFIISLSVIGLRRIHRRKKHTNSL
ncbi:MAG: S8 family serine peptidase, partial [Thermodesulfobacteriota bacterium]